MALIEPRPDLYADRYDGLTNGPGLVYSFETQEGFPVDGTNPVLRSLSPFTLRMVPPEPLQDLFGSDVNINQIGHALQETDKTLEIANAAREALGSTSITNESSAQQRLTSLRSVVTGGVVSRSMTQGQRAVFTDVLTTADIVYQLEKILQMPPLTLLVNPNELSLSYTAVQQYQNKTRHGYIFERWGEGQPSLSISGSTGAFIAAANPNTSGNMGNETDSVSGVQFASKLDSAAFQNFMSLYQFYRNNGYIYDTVGGTSANLMVGAVAIDWDQWTYVGHIESFEFSYDQEQPHRIEWSMEFVIDRMFDLAEAKTALYPMTEPSASFSYPGSAYGNGEAPVSVPYSELGLADYGIHGFDSDPDTPGMQGQFAQPPLDWLLGSS